MSVNIHYMHMKKALFSVLGNFEIFLVLEQLLDFLKNVLIQLRKSLGAIMLVKEKNNLLLTEIT